MAIPAHTSIFHIVFLQAWKKNRAQTDIPVNDFDKSKMIHENVPEYWLDSFQLYNHLINLLAHTHSLKSIRSINHC